MTVRKQQTDELLGLDQFAVDEDTPHVVINKEKCAKCTAKSFGLALSSGILRCFIPFWLSLYL